MVRGKFKVMQHTTHAYNNGAVFILLEPQYDTSIEEDWNFATATPSGKIEMFVSNPKAVAALELGKQFYVDFTPAD